MTDHDSQAFGVLFLKLRNVFNMRSDKADVREAMGVYFGVLRRYPLPTVEAGADAWIEKGTRFPKPAEWLNAIPKAARAGVLVMSEVEAREHRHAMDLHYQDEPCACHLCKTAGVSHRFLRYVPDTDEDDRDVRMELDGKTVARGHWAHGLELQRWYAARDAFYALKRTVKPKAIADAEVQTHPHTNEPFDARTDSVFEDEPLSAGKAQTRR